MIRGGIWMFYGFVNLKDGGAAWIDIALSALFLASMLGFLVGNAPRLRVILSAVTFAFYAAGMFVLLSLVFLAKAIGH
jgi:hypothetical protein